MTKPILIRQSPLSLRWYAFSAYKEKDGYIEVTGQKTDVTDQINEIVKRALEAAGVKP